MWLQVLMALLHASAPTEAGPGSPAVAASVGWQEEPSLDLAAALSRRADAPVFTAPGGGWCVDIGRWPELDGPTKWVWVYCPASTGPDTAPLPCKKLAASSPDLSLLSEECPGEAVAFAELELATCGQGPRRLIDLLSQPSTLGLHIPKTEEVTAPFRAKVAYGPFQGEKVGCASSITSPDGRVRSWTLKHAVRHETPYVMDNAERGEAYLQWLTPKGDLEVVRDGEWADLSLDAAIDGIVPLPGSPKEYLVTGYLFRGFDLLRFAEVISLAGEHPKLSRARFLVGNQQEDILLVSGGYPETGHARHSPVYSHRLELKGHQLWVEPIPDMPCCRDRATKPFVLAEWTGAVFKTTKGGWARLLTLQDLYEHGQGPSRRK